MHTTLEESIYHPLLVDLTHLKPGWDGQDAPVPNDISLQWAIRIMESVDTLNLKASVVMACVDGGVSLLFTHNTKKVLIECFNSGDVTAVVADSIGSQTGWMISDSPSQLTADLIKIRDFLAG